MSTEVAILNIDPGTADQFLEAAGKDALEILHQGGATDLVLYRSEVTPDHFVLVCKWKSREARIEGFEKSPLYTEFVALVGPYLAAAPTIDDYDVVATHH
jgi:quinol monooxygenase YgiN